MISNSDMWSWDVIFVPFSEKVTCKDRQHKHFGQYLKNSSNALVDAILKNITDQMMNIFEKSKDTYLDWFSDAEGMKILHTNLAQRQL